MTDIQYRQIFDEVVKLAFEIFRPHVVVMQAGADSLNGDLLGSFNLSIRNHANLVEFVKNLCSIKKLVFILLGGGLQNVVI